MKKITGDHNELLFRYIDEVRPGDKTNREGHAAKIYFNLLFGKHFVRNAGDSVNAALNYGYAILLSTINKEIVGNGYLTQLGIHHKNEFNQFNLTCDLMEPFRIVIDHFVYHNQNRKFDTEYKLAIVGVLNNTYRYGGKKYTLKDIIKLYVSSTLEVLEKKIEYKDFIYDEE